MRYITTFAYSGRHVAFAVSTIIDGYRSTSADVGNESVESGDPENLDIAVGTACLSVVEREI